MSGVGNPSTVSPDTLALLVDSVTDEALFLTSAEGTILSWNPGAVALTGIPVDQALGQPCPAALDLAALARHWPNFRETALPKPRGGSIPLRAAARSLPTGGHAVRLLRGNRSADSVVFGAIHDALIQTDPQGVVTSWNDGATRLFGWTEPEMVGRPLIERVPPEARPEMTALLERLARGQEPSIEFEDYRKDGSRVWVDLSRRPLTSATGLMIGILWVSHDIHARKLAEQALIAREKFTREVLDATGTILAVLDSNGKILAVNDPWRDFAAHNVPAGHTGAPDDEVGHNYLQVCHQCTGQDRQKALEAATGIESVLRGERKFFALEYACHSPSGEKNWFVLNVLPMGSSGGVVLHINITAQKLSQLRAEEQAERLKLALAAARMGVWDLDLVQNRLHWSPEVYSILGITEFDGNPESWRRLVHPDDVEAQVRHFQHTLETRTTLRSEFRIIRPDGTVRWVTNLAEVHLDANGAPIGVIGTVQDITDKKNAECERLRQITEQRLVSEVLAALLTDLSPQRLTQVVFERVADYLDCDVYTHFEAQGNELHLIGTAGLDAAVVQAFSRIQIGEQICGQVALRNAPLYIPHVQTCDDPLAACIRQVGIRVYLGHPLRAGDQLIGTLAFASRRRDEFADHEREFITTIAQAVATTMTRLRDAREIQQRQDKFRAMIETSPIGFWEVDRTGRILEINDAYLRTSGFTREQILRMSVADVEAVESQTEIIKHIEATSQVGHLTFETLHRNRDGVPWPVEVTGTYLPATDTCFAFLRDITERKKAENALRASEQRYRTLVDHAPDAIVLHNTSGQFLDVNPQACTLFGYQAHELLDLTILDVDVSITAEHLAEAQSKLGGGESFSQDCILRRKDGSTFPVEVHANPLWVDGQQFTLSIVRDITERKTAEHALRASEQRYRTLVDHAPDAIFLHDASGHILDVNPQACASLGYQAHELIRLTVLDVDVSITAEQFAELQSKLRRGESFSRDCIHRRKDGSTFPVEVHANPLWIDKQLFTLCIVRDVSERKRAEQQLLDAQQLQRDILDNVLAYVALLDPTGKIVWLNRPPLEASQVTAPEVLGLSFWDAPPWTYDPAIQAQVRSATEAAARGESHRFDVVARVANDTRRVLDQQPRLARCRWSHSLPDCRAVDITERKKAENALRASEQRYRTLVDRAPDGIFLHDTSGHILEINPQGCASLGYQAHELLGSTALIFDPSISTEQLDALHAALSRGESVSRDCIHRRKDGSTFPVEIHANPLYIDGQQFFLCFVRDITDRKRAEQQLLDAQQLLRDILDNVLAHVALLDPTGKIVWLNRSPLEANLDCVPEVLGLPFWDAPPWTYDPAIQAQVRSATEAAARGESRRFDVVARVAQDARRVLDQQISPLRDADGTVRYLIASDVDITDRKKAEIALRESEDRLRIALKAASALAFAWEIPTDRVIRFFSVEPALGPTGDRPVTLGSVRQQIHPDDLAYFDAQLATTLREGTQYYNRFRVIRPSSEVRWLEEWGQLERDAAGQPLRLTGVAIDITDRQRAEQALLVHNRVLEHIASGATLNSILEEVARLVEEQLPGSHCAILVHHDDARRLSLAAAPSLPPSVRTTLMDIPFNSHHCGCSAAADRGQMVMTADIASDPVWDGFRQQALQFGWHSCLAVPILASSNSSTNRCDRVLGVFTLLRSEPGDPHPLAQTIFSGTTLAPGVSQGSADALAGAAHLASVAIEQDRASRALRESEARFRSVLDNSPALIYLKDLEGRYQFVNRRTAETLGVPQTEWIGHTARQILPPDLADQFDRNDQQILRTLTPHQVEETALDRDGRQITILSIQFPLFRPDGSPYALCGISTDITARIQAESDRSRLWNLTPHLLGIASFDGYFKQMNPSWTRTLGWSEEEFLATPWLDFVHPDDREATIQAGNQLIQGQPVRDFVNRYRHKDGSYRWIHWNTVPFMASRSIYAFARDITEEKLLEEKFRQAQKMEAIGRLAGGVAHDFNNLLTVINGYSEILLAQFPSKDPRREMLDTIRHAGERAATLTAQLLAFSRKAIVELKIIDLNQVVEASTKMLGRLIGEDIYLKVHLAEPLPTIKMDPGQLDQILINLAVNARDAMPHGGTLTIATSDAHIAADQVRDEEPLPPGHYVQMTISDTGCGMNAEVRQRLFEPFFTTKGVGKGTGLGLATVYGIIKQAGGSITVESEPDQGSTFRILLPAASPDSSEEAAALEPSSEPSGRETILLVEDETGVRSLTRQALQMQGYTVIESQSPANTFHVLESHPEPIDLLLTDVIMPEMSGLELARIVRATRPGIKVLFMSGYLDEALHQHGLEVGVDSLLMKPFSLQALACKVREVLDGPAAAHS
ncbi:MAG: PAS domain S-box protein [Gemmataceae bacterium]